MMTNIDVGDNLKKFNTNTEKVIESDKRWKKVTLKKGVPV